MLEPANRKWLAVGAAGMLCGLALLVFSASDTLHHLGLILIVAAPVTAFWRAMKPKLAPHCPCPPEPGWPK
jgi:predicted cobalt transporter CbtA